MRRLRRQVKELQGTHRPGREPGARGARSAAKGKQAAPRPELAHAVVGQPPELFDARQRAAWFELTPAVAATYSPRDRPAFCLLVKQWSELHSPAGSRLPSYVRQALTRSITSLLEAFGCTPKSRPAVELVDHVAPTQELMDPSERFLFGGGSKPTQAPAKPLSSDPTKH